MLAPRPSVMPDIKSSAQTMNSLSGVSPPPLAAADSACRVRSIRLTQRENTACAKGAKPGPRACEIDVRHSSNGKSDLSSSVTTFHLPPCGACERACERPHHWLVRHQCTRFMQRHTLVLPLSPSSGVHAMQVLVRRARVEACMKATHCAGASRLSPIDYWRHEGLNVRGLIQRGANGVGKRANGVVEDEKIFSLVLVEGEHEIL